jgi:hypothetical protein
MESVSHMKERSERYNRKWEEKSSARTISSKESVVIDVNLTSHEYLKSSNFLMFFIYVSELHEESPMDKKHWKKENEVYIENLTLTYTTSCIEVKGREIIKKRDWIRSMKTRGDISTGGVTLFLMISKRKKEKDQKHEYNGFNGCTLLSGGVIPLITHQLKWHISKIFMVMNLHHGRSCHQSHKICANKRPFRQKSENPSVTQRKLNSCKEPNEATSGPKPNRKRV